MLHLRFLQWGVGVWGGGASSPAMGSSCLEEQPCGWAKLNPQAPSSCMVYAWALKRYFCPDFGLYVCTMILVAAVEMLSFLFFMAPGSLQVYTIILCYKIPYYIILNYSIY